MVSSHANDYIFSNPAGSRPTHLRLQMHSLFVEVCLKETSIFLHSKSSDLLDDYCYYSLDFSNSSFLFCRCSGIWHGFDCLCMYTWKPFWSQLWYSLMPSIYLISSSQHDSLWFSLIRPCHQILAASYPACGLFCIKATERCIHSQILLFQVALSKVINMPLSLLNFLSLILSSFQV